MHQHLQITSKTWERDSYGLYDYESLNNPSVSLSLNSSCFISRDGNSLQSSLHKICLSSEYLFDIKQSNLHNGYTISNICLPNQPPTIDSINNLSNKIWYVIPNEANVYSYNHQNIINNNEEYFLTRNDIFKLGRVKFKIAEINFIPNPNHFINGNYNLSYINNTTSPVFKDIHIINENMSNHNECLCKICYSNESNIDNPLINICLCKGGIGYAHYNCIKTWMSTKLTIKVNESQNVKSYNIKQFNCEICKAPYPTKIQIKGNTRIYDLIDVDKPRNNDYVILETLNQIKENGNIKSIHVITLNGDKFVIGRGHECDIRVNDISVSRAHTLLVYNNKEKTLLLKDLKSKFGTLVLIKYPLRILAKPLILQVGRTLIECQLKNVNDNIRHNEDIHINNINNINQYDIINKDERDYKTISDNENNQNKDINNVM